MAHPIFPQQQTTRRSLLKSAVFGSVAAIAAPYVKDSYAAGSLALGVWDHWVPGANNAFAALCNEWGTKNNVEVRIDFITSQGEKDKLTAAAEAQAGTGHEHAGIDLREVFPPDETKWDSAKVDSWNWDAYFASAEKLFKAGYPVGLPMGQTSDSVDWVGALFDAHGVVMVDAKDNIKINSDETRAVLEYAKKLMAVIPPDVYAWDDAGNNRWLISGKGSGIMNPPSAWAVAKRDNPKVSENCWTHPMPRGPKGRFVGQLPQFYGLWSFSKNKAAAKDFLLFISQKPPSRRLA